MRRSSVGSRFFQPDELDRSVAKNFEATALKVVGAAHGVDGAHEPHAVTGLLGRVDVAAQRHDQRSETDRRAWRLQVAAFHDERVGHVHRNVDARRRIAAGRRRVRGRCFGDTVVRLGRFGRVRRRRHERERLIEIDFAGRQPEVAAQSRRAQIARDFETALNPDIAQLVVENLEVIGRDVELHAADATLVERDIAAERQRVVVVVEDGDLGDMDAVGLQLEAGHHVRVDASGRLDLHPAVGDCQGAFGPGIGGSAADPQVCFGQTLHIGQRGRKALHESQIDRAAVDGEIDAVAG